MTEIEFKDFLELKEKVIKHDAYLKILIGMNIGQLAILITAVLGMIFK